MKKDIENNVNKEKNEDILEDVVNDSSINDNSADEDLKEKQEDFFDEALEKEFIEEFNHDELIEELEFGIHSLDEHDEEEVSDESNDDLSVDKNKKNDKKIIIKSVVASSIASLLVSGSFLALTNNNATTPNSTITIKNSTTDNVYKAVATKATPSVVGITTLTIDTNNFFNIPLESEGVGSGVIVDKRGYILTNSHVVNDGKAAKVSVMFADATSVDGKVLWNDSKLDIAIIKVEKDNLDVAELGDSDKVEVGDIAVAIGNPLGLEFNKTVTQGIISGLDRVITTENGQMDDLIQTDASINPGNSGGPLLNSKGQVIGINTAKAGNAEGLGFAIPINTIKPIIEQVISDGNFEKVTLGIKGVDVSQFGLDIESGVYVVAVENDTPAKKAGISSGDIIIELDGKKIENMTALTKSLYKYNKGDKAALKVYKDGQEKEVQVQF